MMLPVQPRGANWKLNGVSLVTSVPVMLALVFCPRSAIGRTDTSELQARSDLSGPRAQQQRVLELLAAAKTEYWFDIDAIGAAIESELGSLQQAAAADRDQWYLLESERTAFRDQGVWPSTTNKALRDARSRWKEARNRLQKAYSEATKGLLLVGLPEFEKSVHAEQNALLTISDAAPWRRVSPRMADGWHDDGKGQFCTPNADHRVLPFATEGLHTKDFLLEVVVSRESGLGGIDLAIRGDGPSDAIIRLGVGGIPEVAASVFSTKNPARFTIMRLGAQTRLDVDGFGSSEINEGAWSGGKDHANETGLLFAIDPGTRVRFHSVRCKPVSALSKESELPVAKRAVEEVPPRPVKSASSAERQAKRTGLPLGERMAANSVWHGTLGERRDISLQHQVVLYVTRRNQALIECLVWFPALADGAVGRWGGQVIDDGTITFASFSVVYGEGTRQRAGLIGGTGNVTFRESGGAVAGEGVVTSTAGVVNALSLMLHPCP
jgi:hypothetical protein